MPLPHHPPPGGAGAGPAPRGSSGKEAPCSPVPFMSFFVSNSSSGQTAHLCEAPLLCAWRRGS